MDDDEPQYDFLPLPTNPMQKTKHEDFPEVSPEELAIKRPTQGLYDHSAAIDRLFKDMP